MSYVSAVAELFRESGQPQLLTANAYTIFAEWEKQQIPLHLVQSTIENISFSGTGRLPPVPQISELINVAFADWLSLPPHAESAPA